MNTIHRCKPLLGTFVEISITADESGSELISLSKTMFDEIQSVQAKMSFHDTSSELNHINQYAHKKPIEMSEHMAIVIKHALSLSQSTQGDYDISVAKQLVKQGKLPDYNFTHSHQSDWQDIVIDNNHIYFKQPMLLDLGGIAKGFAVDRAIEVTNKQYDVTVNAGGDLRMTQWRNKQIPIRVPYSASGETVTIERQAPALATSGQYFNHGHIVSPEQKNIWVDSDLSISIFADSCMVADSLTKVSILHDKSEAIISAFNAHEVKLNRNGKIQPAI